MLSMDAMYKGIDEIENTYVNKRFSLNDKQLNQWYKLLKNLTDEAYLGAIDEWCMTKDTLPSPSNILEIAGRMRPQDNTVEVPKNTKHCSACGNRGVIAQIEFNKKLNRDYEVLYACLCEAGEYYRDKGWFKTIEKTDWENGKIHKTYTPNSVEESKKPVNINKLAEQFTMI